MFACWIVIHTSISAQISFKLELLADDATYQMSMIPDTSYTFPNNLTSSGQVTIRAPHGLGDFRFETVDFMNSVQNTQWLQNTRVDAPEEAPNWDYISFGMISITDAYEYQAGVEIPMFSFKNGGIACVDSIELVVDSDPFFPPNSQNANIGNSLTVLGAGLVNAYTSNEGTGRALCTPTPQCEVESEQEVDLCMDDMYEGRTFERDTIFETNHITAMGCDSIAKHIIKVHPDSFTPRNIVLCDNETYQGQTFERDTTFREDYVSQYGCDSVFLINITLAQSYDEMIDVTIPRGSLYEGQTYDQDERVILNLQSEEGCDSTVTVQITVVDNPTRTEDVNLCGNEMYNGQSYTETTSVFDTIPGNNGDIDTILITNIFVSPTYDIVRDTMLCGNETYNGQTYTESTTITEEFKTISGCDSIITININISEGYNDVLFVAVCERVAYEGVIYPRDTSFTQTFTAQNGCDSIVTRNINVLENPPIPLPTEIILCDETELPLELDAGDYVAYQWSTGSNSQQITVTQLGEYFVRVTNSRGCQDSVTVDIRLADLSLSTDVLAEGCAVDALHSLHINAEATELPLLYSIDGGATFVTESQFTGLDIGTYDILVEDMVGCQASSQVKIQPNEDILLVVPDELYIDLGDSIEIKARTNSNSIDSIVWSPADDLSCTDCLKPVASPDKNRIYELTLFTVDGCKVSQQVVVYVDRSAKYYAPNIFSPNDDGENDLFTIFPGANIKEITNLKIFNRWGNLMFHKAVLNSTDVNSHWEGKIAGKEAPVGVYVYSAVLELVNGKREVIEGEIMLVR